MRVGILVAVVLALSSLAEATISRRGIYCTQISPARNRGVIIAESFLETKGSKKALIMGEIGVGLLTQQGDGTINDMWWNGGAQMTPDPSYVASSAQWKKALAFPLAFGDTAEYVLHVHEKDFKGGDGTFKARLRIIPTEGGKEESIILNCSQTSWESKGQWACPKKLAKDAE